MRLVLITAATLILGIQTAHAEDREKARQAFAEGRQHFDLGEYKDALDSFKLAYRNFEDPKILFNIAQCHRQLGNKEEAVSFYRKYLSKIPNAPNHEEVQTTIDKLNAALAAERASKSTPPQGTLGEPPPGGTPATGTAPPTTAPATQSAPATAMVTPAVTREPEKKPLVKKWWLWTAVGAGVVAVGLGVGLGLGLSHKSGTDFPGVAF